MNTKKAVEFVDMIPNNGILFDPQPLEKRKEQLKEMLKRGEKCCKIIERLRNTDANISIFSKNDETISITALDIYLDEIEKEV